MSTIAIQCRAAVAAAMIGIAWLPAQTAAAALDPATEAALDAAINGAHRSAANKARDSYRHPQETLAFFGFRSDMTVVEVWPGGGWYTEILAPALQADGRFYAAQYSVNPAFGYQREYFGSYLSKLGGMPDLYRDVIVTHLAAPHELEIAPRGSADMVVTFRNVHNWFEQGYGKHAATLGFVAMFDALKPGGILGIVDHRWPDASNEDPGAENGYISEERTIAYAEAAGFEFAGRSDINRNPRDTHDHPQGVWTLPPSLALGEQDRERYLAIGESDRYTLKFVKPRE
ncbi:MAG TPA: methyltransferase [Woeseiaceae bacterium]|nr:methyltransferase [Woeseiaceae bacterium]